MLNLWNIKNSLRFRAIIFNRIKRPEFLDLHVFRLEISIETVVRNRRRVIYWSPSRSKASVTFRKSPRSGRRSRNSCHDKEKHVFPARKSERAVARVIGPYTIGGNGGTFRGWKFTNDFLTFWDRVGVSPLLRFVLFRTGSGLELQIETLSQTSLVDLPRNILAR